MKRNLFSQMAHEWRDNLWLVLALAIVSLAVWLFAAKLEYLTRGLLLPRGFDVEEVYQLNVNRIHSNSPEYVSTANVTENVYDHDLLGLLTRIRESPNVEEAAFSFSSNPYFPSQYSGNIFLTEEEDSIGYGCFVKMVNPAFAKVLGFKSTTGKSNDDLVNILKKGKILVTTIGNPYGDYNGMKPEELLGKKVILEDNEFTVGDIIDFVQESEYNMPNIGMAIIPVAESDNMQGMGFLDMNQLSVKVKPGCGNKFVEEFHSDESMRRQRNVYLTELISLKDAGEAYNLSVTTHLRLMLTVIVALMAIVSLGMFGVFWFRIQRRVSEIAIRKVCGASRNDIFRRIIGESMILLGIATLLAAAIGWIIIYASGKDGQSSFLIGKYLLTEAFTLIFVAMGIVLSVWWPARRAMRIEPAIAIKDE